jgi:hypothetical protein
MYSFPGIPDCKPLGIGGGVALGGGFSPQASALLSFIPPEFCLSMNGFVDEG